MRRLALPLCAALLLGACAAQAAKRTSGCKSATHPMEQLVCQDPGLQRLERQLGQVFAQALQAAGPEHERALHEEQRHWRLDRNLCLINQTDRRACMTQQYRLRTAELQARFMLVPHSKPLVWLCDDMPGSEIIVTHFRTEPQSLMAERDGRLVWMGPMPAASGARYGNEQEWLWEHQGTLSAQWDGEPVELSCSLKVPARNTAPAAPTAD